MQKILPKIIDDIFIISFITFVVYLAFEVVFEGLVSNYFDLNFLLIMVVVFGLISLLTKKSAK